MIRINNYILEKLYIGKGYKHNDPDTVVDDIVRLTGVILTHKDITEYIREWVEEYSVSKVEFYTTERWYDILKDNYNVDEDEYLKNYIINKDVIDKSHKAEVIDEERFEYTNARIVLFMTKEYLIYDGYTSNNQSFEIVVKKV